MKSIELPLPLTWIQSFDFPHKLGICEMIFGQTISSHGICWVKTGSGLTPYFPKEFSEHTNGLFLTQKIL